MAWFEWLWTIASIMVMLETPIAILMYYRWHIQQKGTNEGS